MKKVGIVLCLVLFVASGYVGFLRYKQYKFIEFIRSNVRNSTLRLANTARYEISYGAKITFKELFEKIESDIVEIDKRVLEVQTVSALRNKDITGPVLEYLEYSQELFRSLLAKNRKQLALKIAYEGFEKAADNMKSAGRYSIVYAVKASDQATKDLEKAVKEADEAKADVVDSTDKLKGARVKVAAILPDEDIIDPIIIDAILRNNKQKPEDTGGNK